MRTSLCRELVLKLVNGAERKRTLQLRGLPLSRQGKGEILTADSLRAENALDHPNLVAPRPWPVRGVLRLRCLRAHWWWCASRSHPRKRGPRWLVKRISILSRGAGWGD